MRDEEFAVETPGDLLIFADHLEEEGRSVEADDARRRAHLAGFLSNIAGGLFDGFLDKASRGRVDEARLQRYVFRCLARHATS